MMRIIGIKASLLERIISNREIGLVYYISKNSLLIVTKPSARIPYSRFINK